MIDAGEALARIADNAHRIWTIHMDGCKPEKLTAIETEARDRSHGLCAVPGCTARGMHKHHIIFRSHGGPEEAVNIMYVCTYHHLRGIHGGHLNVSGRAGEKLVWVFGASGKTPISTWETRGKDDVHRVSEVGATRGSTPVRDAG